MELPRRLFATLIAALALGGATAALAADYPEPKAGDWVTHDFRFHTGEVMKDVRLHYVTVGDPKASRCWCCTARRRSSTAMLTPHFAGELFGPGQPLDASRYYLIITDALGTGKSTRPSDGLRAKFPQYDYDDMVRAQYLLVTEGLGVKHLRLVIGNSMGGMQAWMWAEMYPGFMDAIVPMACQPIAMSGRNWMLRRMFTESIRNDPDWKGGDYTVQPPGMARHLTYHGFATSGGSQALYRQAPDAARGDALIAKGLAAPFKGDANDVLFQWESSADFDPSPGLERIEATVLAINSGDDERNPTELGVMESQFKRVKNGSYYIIPGSPQTSGHATTGDARFYKSQLADLLARAPHR